MEQIITDFDREVHRKKIGRFRDRLKEDGSWKYEVQNGEKFSFSLKDGTNLDVLEYSIDKDGAQHDQFKFLLAKIGDVVVGFLAIEIYNPNKKSQVGRAGSNIGVIIKGKGIGGRLESVKNLILQREANRIGTIIDIGDDENKSLVLTELEKITDEVNYDEDTEKFLRRLKNLIVNRGNWLALYGRGGKSRYTQVDKTLNIDSSGTKMVERKIFKRFRKDEPLPLLNCVVTKNETNLKEEAEKIRW